MKDRTSRKRRNPESKSDCTERQTRLHSVSRPLLAVAVVVVLTVVGLQVVMSGAPLQEETSATQTEATLTNSDPPGTIAGAKNPELIPDEVAFRLAFLGIAEPENATEEQKARARAKITSIRLREEDAEAFLYLLSQFQTRLDTLTAQMVEIQERSPIMHPLSTDAEKMRELLKQTYQLYADTIAALPAKLSLEGVEKLRAYVQQEKRTMKIIPDTSANVMPTN